MDIIHKITNVFDHHRYLVFSLAIGLACFAWLAGCTPTTTSTLDPETQVTARQLEREVAEATASFEKRVSAMDDLNAQLNADIGAYNAQVQSAEGELAEKIEYRKSIIEIVGGLGAAAAGGTLTPGVVAGSLITLLGVAGSVGGGLDVIRKNRVITQLKNGADATG